MTADSIIAVARRFDFVRETAGANAGLFVEDFLRFTGNRRGESWCCSFVSRVLDIVYRGRSPLLRTAGCDEMLNDAERKGYVVREPRAGDLVFSVKGAGNTRDAHHVGIVTVADPLTAIAGNTSSDGLSSNGDGVYEHAVTRTGKIFVRLPEVVA